MPTVPNQKVVHIHRAPLNKDNGFLGINNANWKSAARILGAQAFLLYIYFAANKDNFVLAMSPAAIMTDIGMPRSTYHDQLRKLKSLGYLVEENGRLHFYEVPKSETRIQPVRVSVTENEAKCPSAVNPCSDCVQDNPPEDIEINNKYKNKLTNSARVDVPLGEGFHY